MKENTIQNNSTSDPDQRYLPRWEVKKRVFFQVESDIETREGYSNDISCSGICIFTNRNVLPKQSIKLKIYLSGETWIDIRGNVLWVKPSSNGNYLGVSFYGMTSNDQDLILQYAFELDEKKLSDHWFKDWSNN